MPLAVFVYPPIIVLHDLLMLPTPPNITELEHSEILLFLPPTTTERVSVTQLSLPATIKESSPTILLLVPINVFDFVSSFFVLYTRQFTILETLMYIYIYIQYFY